jgi:EEF1A lysine methyltransferase 2
VHLETKEHWNHAYSKSDTTKLGWYEAIPQASLELIARCQISQTESILDVGSGTTNLISELIALGYTNLFALDISPLALMKAKSLLHKDQAGMVKWIEADVTQTAEMDMLPEVSIWHDRALFHFLTTDDQRNAYHILMQKKVKREGHVILATFAPDGASKCSGLDVRRYSSEQQKKFMGHEFELVETSNITSHTPSGALRPYVYSHFIKM